jgi:hypothetical protein
MYGRAAARVDGTACGGRPRVPSTNLEAILRLDYKLLIVKGGSGGVMCPFPSLQRQARMK